MKRILVAPLDWGLGHAARCVPVIQELLKNNAEVIIAADKNPLSFLQKEFPALECIRFPGYEISYPSQNENMALKMFFQIPKILSKISEENKFLQKIIRDKKIDAVISDQRFGLYSSSVPCIFISHQIMIKTPFFENILYGVHKKFIEKYAECWIPDFEGEENLSGDLSHKFPLPQNAKFIGALSRFFPLKPITIGTKLQTPNYEVMAIISGPEPQRSIFENLVSQQLKKSGKKSILVRGRADIDEHNTDGNIEIYSHLGTEQMREKILSSEIIISRSGYSTIMDLAALGKKAILVPTPGQTEQEYLAANHHQQKHFFSMKQKEFDLEFALAYSSRYNGINFLPEKEKFREEIKKITSHC